ncbi:MAG: hypothetical protein JWM90_2882 [Thermoleophilia bacterium]|nr:hypothetical protein [Thermoleophilia bacterium]
MQVGRIDRAVALMRAGGVLAAGGSLLLIATCIIVVAVMASDGQFGGASPDDGAPTFSTTASGTVEVPPTSATTSIQLLGCGEGPGSALQQANGRLAGMTRTWRELGIPKGDISRGNVSTSQQSAKRWCTNLTVVATVDDLELVDEVLTGIAKYPRGIQGIQGPAYDYDPAKLEEGALDQAMQVARSKADDAARRAGTKVVGVRTISEGGVNVQRPEDANPSYEREMYDTSGTAGGVALKSYTTAVSRNPGEATATVSVEAVFLLDD